MGLNFNSTCLASEYIKLPLLTCNPNNICDTTSICIGNLGIPRILMPQIENSKTVPVLDNFVNYFKDKGTAVEYTSIPANRLISTQNEGNLEKVMGIVKAAMENKFNPCNVDVLVAGDMHIVDGHHRAFACRMLGEDATQKVIMVNERIQNLLETAKTFPGVVYQSLNTISK